MWCFIFLITEEPNIIKFNKVVVMVEAYWQCARFLPLVPRLKQPVWSSVNPFTGRAKQHKQTGPLGVFMVHKFFQCFPAC